MDELDGLDDELDDLDINEDEVPSYVVSTNAATNKNELKQNANDEVDQYGLPKELDQIQMNQIYT